MGVHHKGANKVTENIIFRPREENNDKNTTTTTTTTYSRHHIYRTMALPVVPTIPVSLVDNGSISLPLDGPLHVYITVPFSLLVKDFDPNTTRVPPWVQPAPWWWPTWLFGPRYKTPTNAEIKAYSIASPVFQEQLWPKLSALLFGKEEPALYTVVGSDIKDWEHAAASHLFWTLATGVTDENVDRIKAVVLTPISSASRPGLFTVEELGAVEEAAWKKSLMDTVQWEFLEGEERSPVDFEINKRNHGLFQYMRHRDYRPSDEKQPVEKEPLGRD
ncbi:hypothetical protein B0I37DRAFT_381748 [Chaetomium sp. MPI-CAGE-AT-0009]|nr:hypothetical protein B0I37DRAFT_381748 [Chaetomium sp. MPI-CAGE-AT-0009]